MNSNPISLAQQQYMTRATLDKINNVDLLDNLSGLGIPQAGQNYRPYSVEKNKRRKYDNPFKNFLDLTMHILGLYKNIKVHNGVRNITINRRSKSTFSPEQKGNCYLIYP